MVRTEFSWISPLCPSPYHEWYVAMYRVEPHKARFLSLRLRVCLCDVATYCIICVANQMHGDYAKGHNHANLGSYRSSVKLSSVPVIIYS